MENTIISRITGTWELISIFYKDNNNNKIDLYGANPRGILIYDKNGYMSAHLGASDRSWFKDKDPEDNSYKIASHDSFMAYYGKYYEKEPGTIIHKVEGSLKPWWEGMELIRYAVLEENTLYIYTPETEIDGMKTKIEVFWTKL